MKISKVKHHIERGRNLKTVLFSQRGHNSLIALSPSVILVRKGLVFARLEGSLIDDTKSSSCRLLLCGVLPLSFCVLVSATCPSSLCVPLAAATYRYIIYAIGSGECPHQGKLEYTAASCVCPYLYNLQYS